MKMGYTSIGVIHSPFKDVVGMPLQPQGAQGTPGTVEVMPEYGEGLTDIEGFSHIMLLYHFHLSDGYSLLVQPFLDDSLHGVFATRAPRRPNSIGISVVKLIRVEGSTLHVEDVDVVDGTPLLDIKPYVPAFDAHDVERIGWLSERVSNVRTIRANDRFR